MTTLRQIGPLSFMSVFITVSVLNFLTKGQRFYVQLISGLILVENLWNGLKHKT